MREVPERKAEINPVNANATRVTTVTTTTADPRRGKEHRQQRQESPEHKGDSRRDGSGNRAGQLLAVHSQLQLEMDRQRVLLANLAGGPIGSL